MGKHRGQLVIFAAGLVLVVLMLTSLALGAVYLPPHDIWHIISGGQGVQVASHIFFYVRLPRTLAATLAGAALACAGAILQTCFANPMCSPNIIGVNAGAGLFTVLANAYFPQIVGAGAVAAFAGAMVAAFVVYTIARNSGASRLSFVLAGLAISSLFSALTDAFLTMVPEARPSRIDFMIGSFSGVTMDHVGAAGAVILLGLLVCCVFHNHLNVLALGESVATSLGLQVARVRCLYLVLAALLAGCAISFSGLIGFVGLLVPHIARRIIGTDHRFLLPLCILGGGGFCLFCDIAARVLFVPYEAPVGVIMSLVGSPFFVWLILRGRRQRIFD